MSARTYGPLGSASLGEGSSGGTASSSPSWRPQSRARLSGSGDGSVPHPRSVLWVDLRLVPFVLVLWLVEWFLLSGAGIRDPSTVMRHAMVILGSVAAVGMALGMVLGLVRAVGAPAHLIRLPRCATRAPPWQGALMIPLAVACGVVAATSSLAPLVGAPWSGLHDGAHVELSAVTTSSPVVLSASAGRGPALVGITVQAQELVYAGRREPVRQRVRVLAPQAVVGDVLAGTQVTVSGRWSPRRPGRLEAGTVRAGLRSGWIVDAPPRGLSALSARVRNGLAGALATASPDAATLVRGLTLGDTTGTSDELGQAMQRAGLSHLSAVSGSNVAIVVGFVGVLAVLLGAGKGIAVGAGAAALAAYTIVVGTEPSVVRAAAMGAVLLIGLASGIRAGPSRLLVAVAVLLLTDPWLSVSAGFAMSAGATAALVALNVWGRVRSRRSDADGPSIAGGASSRPPQGRSGMGPDVVFETAGGRGPGAGSVAQLRRTLGAVMRRARGVVIAASAVAGVAFLATTPVVVGLGQPIPVYSVVANLAAAPAVPIVTVLGLIAAVVSLASPALAGAVAVGAGVPAGWIAWTAHRVSAWPGAAWTWPSGRVGVLAVVVAELALLLVARGCLRWWSNRANGVPLAHVQASRDHEWPPRNQAQPPPGRTARVQRSRVRVALAGLTLILTAVVGVRTLLVVMGRQGAPPGWVAAFCDVGQGDAAVVRTGPSSAVLVDAGPEPGRVDRCLRRLRVSHLDTVLLTHFHADHAGGLAGALRGRSTGAILVSPLADPPAGAAAVEAQAGPLGQSIQVASAGMVFRVGTTHWTVLWPARLLVGDGSGPNNASVATVVALEGGLCLFLGADIEPAAQSAVLAAAQSTRQVPAVDGSGTAPDLPAPATSGDRAGDAADAPAGDPAGDPAGNPAGDASGGRASEGSGLWPAGCTTRVVKVPHHGSRHQDPRLAAWAHAQWAVISVGENDYGHPAAQTLRAWQEAGSQVRRTDRGMVVIDAAPGQPGAFQVVGGA